MIDSGELNCKVGALRTFLERLYWPRDYQPHREKLETNLEIEGKPSTNVTPKEPLDLATIRTILAADRTLMAWIRTSFTLLGFGFTIYAILKALQDAGKTLPRESTPQNLGLFLSVMGIFSILLGTVDYWMTL